MTPITRATEGQPPRGGGVPPIASTPTSGSVRGWQREPYRLFFPLGMLLAWGGVLHWMLHAVGLLPDYRPVFHSIAQIQGFMMCFAVGFLFTAIPRRTGTAPPATWQVVLGLLLPVGTTVGAWFENMAIAQICWVSLVGLLVTFAVRRFMSRDAARRPPGSFVWVPLSLGMGVVGSFMTGGFAVLGPDYHWLHEIGKSLLLQGMFLGMVVGVGGMVLPLITCGDAPPDAVAGRARWLPLLGHLSAATLLAGSFWVETSVSLRSGLALRGALVLVLLLVVARIGRLPRVPGWHRWLIWLSAWAIPAGYLLAALYPAQKKAGLHVVFIGGFAMMALAVGIHVTLAHGGHRRLVSGRPWQVPILGGLLLAAMLMRALVDFDQARFFLWLGGSAAAFLIASLVWASLVLPHLRESRAMESPAHPSRR